ncbi:Tyrosine--tRNA ligase, cytoplasmic [Astathelohania contejeani]|uniref:Tyrosine--tRNA ligase, cytoplasmic n=1 Tax=Astathelohania contejeani TaxID=164912 RepID=A0ABQ7I232_9MICR|nr:Tyrosine--tRNA ligase, cytoplasmic [Thelohania contejeani]
MELIYGPDFEDIAFAIKYLNYKMNYSLSSTEIMLVLDSGTAIGLKNVLHSIIDLCRCDPHDFDIINPEIVDKIIEMREVEPHQYLKQLLARPDDDKEFDASMPSNIDIHHYVNQKNATLADLVLFARIYKLVREGKKLESTEREWFECFQREMARKMEFEHIADPDFALLEIRAGKIISIDDHPNADSLYVETVDIGTKIQVVSGLRGKVNKEDLLDKIFLFIVNMKPSKLRGIVSEGMILCVKDDQGNVEPIGVPMNAMPGYKLVLLDEKIQITSCYDKPKISATNERFKCAMNAFMVENNKLLFNGRPLGFGLEPVVTKTEKGNVS